MSVKQSLKAARYEDLPIGVFCNLCKMVKPLAEMVVFFSRKVNLFCVKSRCKECHNALERGHRREYKREYLRRWRMRNAELCESYYLNNPRRQEQGRRSTENYIKRHGDAYRIQGRMRRHGMPVSIEEAHELLRQFGRCYPSRIGLTAKGLRECERIRARLRTNNKKSKFNRRIPSSFEIRLMVYEQSLEEPGLVIPPVEQPVPFQQASKNMTRTQGRFRAMRAAA